MAMTISTEGLTEVSEMLGKLGSKAEEVASKALYDGAGIVADAFSAAANSIVTEPFHYLARPDITGTKRYPSPEEKAAIQGKSGIAEFNKHGSEVDTLIGISGAAGYADVAGKPKAVRLIARSINSGTSFMQKQPFIRKAAKSGGAKALNVMKAYIEDAFGKITK